MVPVTHTKPASAGFLFCASATFEDDVQRLSESEFEAQWEWPVSIDCPDLAAHAVARPPVLDYPPEIRVVIHTTNAVESNNMSLRRSLKTAVRSAPTAPRASCYIWH